MTNDEFRTMALKIPAAVERSHMNPPDFRVAGKIFASLGVPDKNWGMVKLTPEQQRPRFSGPQAARGAGKVLRMFILPARKTSIVRAALDAAAKNVANRKERKTPNVQRRTSNAQ